MANSSKIRFIGLIVGSIIIALLLVYVSIGMYFSSGTAQVDLSRPGYKSVRDNTPPEDSYKGFSSTGVIDAATLKEFEKAYQERSKNATSVDAFNSDVLSDTALNIADDDSNAAQ